MGMGKTRREEYTFDNFVVCGSNRRAYEAAREISAFIRSSATTVPYIFYNAAAREGAPGKRVHGIGVTHLLLAAVNELRAKGYRITYFSTEEYCMELTRAIQAQATDAFRTKLLTDSDCLVLDNIELFEGRKATQELMVQVIEELAAAGKRTLAGCSGDIRVLSYFLRRIQESFPSRRLIAVTPLDKKGKLKLINQYCRELELKLTVEEKRHIISDDVRSMRGRLMTWKAQRELSLDVVK